MAHLAISPAANIKGEEKTAANFLLWPLAPAGISYKRWFTEEPNSSVLLEGLPQEKEGEEGNQEKRLTPKTLCISLHSLYLFVTIFPFFIHSSLSSLAYLRQFFFFLCISVVWPEWDSFSIIIFSLFLSAFTLHPLHPSTAASSAQHKGNNHLQHSVCAWHSSLLCHNLCGVSSQIQNRPRHADILWCQN